MYSVLIVDDEKAIRENLPKAVSFKDYGFEVCGTAINGKDALDKINKISPDLILLDVCMPVMDGIELLKEIKKGDYPDIRVIMLSGYSDFEYAKAAMRYGVKAYLTKPIDEDELFLLMEEIYKELEESKKSISEGLNKEKMKSLQKLYRSGEGNRDILKSMFLMHCVLLSSDYDTENQNPFDELRECIEAHIDGAESSHFRTRGSLYTYILSEEILDSYDNNISLFAKHLHNILSKRKLKCALLIDKDIFETSENPFRKDYDNHLHNMLTSIFYEKSDVIIYTKAFDEKYKERLYNEEQLLGNLRKEILELNWESVERELKGILTEIEEKHFNIEFIQEINYRLYYMLTGLISLVSESRQEPFIRPLEWRENLFFPTFKVWKEIQYIQMKEVYSFIEKSRKLSVMGVCGGVIEYVHTHYKEPISIKEVADSFFINATYLGRVFKKATGKSFKQYLNDLRIAEAKRLLRQTDKLIYEIAETIGFKESKYFIARFTSDVGLSPLEYRKSE